MPGLCCQKPLTKIIRVGMFDAGIVGLEEIMTSLAESDWADEQELATQLLAMARKRGTYISPASEELYKLALVREFKAFTGTGAQKK